jgi:hypothetical protein
METLQAIYIALAVFGVGVTIVDLFGALDHGPAGGHEAAGHDAAGHGGHEATGHAGHDAAGHDAGHEAAGHDAAGHGGHEAAHPDRAEGPGAAPGDGSLLGSAKAEGRAAVETVGLAQSATVARLIGILRTSVYFSLGAGPTGIAALAMKLDALSSLFWAAGAGMAITVFVRLLRRFIRRDLDSSFSAEDFILEDAEVTVPVAPGLMGRAIVRRFGAQAEVYIKATTEDRAFARGDRVRIIDFQDDCYLVEGADEEHLVH